MDIFFFISSLIWGLIWGFAVKTVIRNKGYDEDWFWWGFFFSFIALLVAIAKPANPNIYNNYNNGPANNPNYMPNNRTNYTPNYNQNTQGQTNDDKNNILNSGGWLCKCGRANHSYVGTCVCGCTKNEAFGYQQQKNTNTDNSSQSSNTARQEAVNKNTELDNIRLLKEFKDLLDANVISEEEFEAKKKELLNLK